MIVRPFGRVDGVDIVEATIRSGGGAEARVITWGGVVRSLTVPGRQGPQETVLGLDTLDEYVRHSPYFGAVVGRYANRIGDARFRLGGRDVKLVPNENGNELHGGPDGFGRRPWSLLGGDDGRVHLGLVSEDGDSGYPGRLFAFATYEFTGPATLRLSLQAVCDRPSPVNLTCHGYYNLDGDPDARGHLLTVEADFTTPTDDEMIPTGEIASIAGTRLDFRQARTLRGTGAYQDIDQNFIVRPNPSGDILGHAATLSSERSGVSMELWTTEPGLQVYDGHLVDLPVQSSTGMPLRPYAGIALEPQRFPDAPNRVQFPSAILQPGAVSRQVSELRFSLS